MSQTSIPGRLRDMVRQRALGLCEYCLLHETDTIHGFHVDHVISEKHGGPTEEHNLAWACPFCNRAKGSDIAGEEDGALARLFNPRIDMWTEHFSLESERIVARSAMASLTVRLPGLNDAFRLALRRDLIRGGRFPSNAARQHSGF